MEEFGKVPEFSHIMMKLYYVILVFYSYNVQLLLILWEHSLVMTSLIYT